MGKDLKGKELGKGIAQRKDGTYQGRFLNRFGERKSVYGSSVKEVKNKLAQAELEEQKKSNIVDEKIILDDWFEKWMRVYKEPVVRLSTKTMYKSMYIRLISPILGKKRLVNITKLMVTDLLNNLAKKGYQYETLNKIKILLIDMLDRAMEDQFLLRNPAKGVRLPKNKPQKETKALSREDQTDFFECSAGTFYNNMFVVAVNTGLRPGELYALTEDDIDLENNVIHVNHTLLYQKLDGDTCKTFHMGPPKTECSKRTVPINSYCRKALQKQIIQHKVVMAKTCKTDLEFPDLLFTTKYGTSLNAELYLEAINRIVQEVNLTRDSLDLMDSFSGHCFRHTFATRCFEAGIAPKTVQAYLGHASLQMTMDLYTAVMEHKKVDDMQLLEDTIDMPDPAAEFGLPGDEKIIKFCS